MGKDARLKMMMLIAALAAVALLSAGVSSAAAKRRPASRATSAPPSSSYPAIGVAVDTAAPAAGGGYEIRIGGNCTANLAGCRVRHFPYGSKPVQMLVLKRASLNKVGSVQLSGGPHSAAEAAALAISYGAQGGYMIVIGARPGTPVSTSYAVALSFITGSSASGSIGANGGWSAIGVPHVLPPGGVSGTLNVGASPEPGRLAGALRGFFQQNLVNSNYSFVTGRYRSYNTYAPGSSGTIDVMAIGPLLHTLALPSGCTGGFGVVVVDAATLAPVSQQATGTNCGSFSQDQSGLEAVEATLDQAAGRTPGSELVFLQSIGSNPVAPNAGLQAIAAQSGADIEELGGSAEIWNRAIAAGTGYALVGATAVVRDSASPAEASGAETASVITTNPAKLQGTLRSDHNWNYVPASGAALPNTLRLSLTSLVYNVSESWPTGGRPNQLAALEYISAGMPRQNGAPRFTPLQYSSGSSCYHPTHLDVRFEFCDLTRNYTDVQTALGDNKTMPANCHCGTTGKAWSAVRNDILNEISDLSKVRTYLGRVSRLYSNGTTCANAYIDLQSIAGAIKQDVTVSNNALITGGRWDALVSDTFNVLSALSYSFPDYGTLSNFLNDVSAFGYLSGDALGFSQSGNSLASEVNTTAGQLAPQLQQVYCNAGNGFGRYTNVILSNYGKLQAAAGDKNFQLDRTTFHALLTKVSIGAKQWVYDHLMPAVYHPYALLPSSLNPAQGSDNQPRTPANYRCPRGYDPTQYRSPWPNIPSADYEPLSTYDPATPSSLDGRQAIGLVLSASPPDAGTATVPPASLMSTVTGPISGGGLGEPAINLFLHHFPRYAYICGYSSITAWGPVQARWP